MASFEIPDAPATVKLTGDAAKQPPEPRTGTAQFTVNNRSDSTMNAQLTIGVQGDSKPEWFSIDGDGERRLESSKSETVNVKIAVPPTVAAGQYPFRLRVAAVNDPDNDFIDGPATTAEVEGRAAVVKKGIPWWVWLIVALVLLGIVGGIVWAVTRDKGGGGGDGDATTAASSTPAVSDRLTVPDLTGKNRSELATLAAGFEVVQQEGSVMGLAPGTILTQNPTTVGSQVPKDTLLRVTYDPGVPVPQLTNLTADQAIHALQPSLFVSNSVSRCETVGATGQIVDQDPKPDARVASHTGVTIFVRIVPAATTRMIRCNQPFRLEELQAVNPDLIKTSTMQRNAAIMRLPVN